MEGKKILVVDDGPEIVETLRVILESHGFKVSVAYDGIEAVEKARLERPDLILLDAMLPKLSGWKVCRKLKEDTSTKYIPIIMVTAQAHPVDRFKGIRMFKVDDYVVKPFSTNVLLQKIQDIIKEREL